MPKSLNASTLNFKSPTDKQLKMYRSFVQKFTIFLCLVLFIHEVHPLALKKNGKEGSLLNQDGNLQSEQLNERSKRSVEHEKGESIETGVANYETHNREKRKLCAIH